MEKFVKGFFVGLGKFFGAKIIGPFNVCDLMMAINVGFGIWRGWGDPNPIIAWTLAGWLWLCLKWAEETKGDEETMELLNEGSETLKLAAAAIEKQQSEIRELKAEVERLKNQGAV